MGSVALVLNPVARGAGAARRAVEEACREAGTGLPRVLPTTPEDPGAAQARAAVDAGCSRVVVAGGDGTVREVAGVVGTRATLGIVPCGTANLAARNLGLPVRSPRAAARIAVSGAGRGVDLGRVELRHADGAVRTLSFLVVVGVGHDAQILAGLSATAKARTGWWAYVTPGLRRLGSPGLPVRVRLDDTEERAETAWSVLAVNGGRLPLGARLVPGAGALMDDGLLHLAVVRPRRARDWTSIGATGLGVRRREHPALSYRTGRSVVVDLPAPGPVQVDGDVVPDILRVCIELLPAAVRVATKTGFP
ncbi:diacylglycerol kinase family protein [uncultured Serinicoccus sp.]|uniref:diacylglycerol/lipid kinase family protein n=1 Tax=uncultured Serinicoccus sp. TaxID=735514 RepID=UPI00261A5C81|nr:diacylglycerol kinase family protein [uncultured Serinicoccus sp.]